MKRLFILAAVIAAATGLIASGNTEAAESYNWSGYYVGANLGGSWGRSSTDLTLDRGSPPSIGSASLNMNGALGGLQAGYNWQTASVVFGLATDFQITGQRGSSQFSDTILVPNFCLAPCTPPPPTPVTGTFDTTQKLPWFGTLRGVLGMSPLDRWLVYATGGLAYGKIQTEDTISVPGGGCLAPCTPPPTSAGGSFTQYKAGWVFGAGVEAALGGNWTGKVEYLHIDFGNISNSFSSSMAPPFLGTFTESRRLTDDIVRVGLNYRLLP